jgi:hypothetical protein
MTSEFLTHISEQMEMKRYAKRSHIQTRLPTVLTATEIKVRLTLLMLFTIKRLVHKPNR